MAVPKSKTSKSKRDQRRSHHALKQLNLAADSKTGEIKLRHHISPKGFFNGRKVFEEKKSDSDSNPSAPAA